MTEHKDSSAMVEETTPVVDTSTPEPQPPRNAKNNGTVLSVVAIAIALAVGAGLYMYGKHQAQQQAAASQASFSDCSFLSKALPCGFSKELLLRIFRRSFIALLTSLLMSFTLLPIASAIGLC